MGCKGKLAMCWSSACFRFLANHAVTRYVETDNQVIKTEQHWNYKLKPSVHWKKIN